MNKLPSLLRKIQPMIFTTTESLSYKESKMKVWARDALLLLLFKSPSFLFIKSYT
uniref:Uncharacterized protein n=1 Tax=Saccharolobus islandicus TaxID=43080 RepID=Q5W2V0_SACIS|nr:hypothetical protein [Sulfolobus islandicus]